MTIIFAIIIFLFSLFALAKDDFVLLRKNILLRTIFDIAFISMLVGLLFARIFYVASHFSKNFLNPLVFFVIPYFPGLVASGLIFGSVATLYLFIMGKKLPLGKLFDIFSHAFFITVGFYFLENAIVFSLQGNLLEGGINIGISFLVWLLTFAFQKITTQFSWKDGFAAYLYLAFAILAFLGSSFWITRFKSIPQEFPYFIGLFFILFLSFLVSLFKRTSMRV